MAANCIPLHSNAEEDLPQDSADVTAPNLPQGFFPMEESFNLQLVLYSTFSIRGCREKKCYICASLCNQDQLHLAQSCREKEACPSTTHIVIPITRMFDPMSSSTRGQVLYKLAYSQTFSAPSLAPFTAFISQATSSRGSLTKECLRYGQKCFPTHSLQTCHDKSRI